MTANSSLMRAWMQSIWYRSESGLVPYPTADYPAQGPLCRISVFALILLLSLPTGQVAADTRSDGSQPISVQADQSDFDEKAGIQRLTGNVEITQGTLSVKADSIQIELKDGALLKIIGEGSPIRFQQQTETGATMSGQSNRIEYNTQTTQITFSGDARFERPGQKLSGNSITYNMSDLTFKASGDKKGRVSIILQPSQIKR